MLNDPACLLGLSDGGAHCTSIVDGGLPSFMLTHWARDRKRGPRLPLEPLVKRQTSETADFFGLTDRGRLAPGLRADVNVIDYEGLQLHMPELVNDCLRAGVVSSSASTAMRRRWSPARQSSSAVSTPARCRASWCAPGATRRLCTPRNRRRQAIVDFTQEGSLGRRAPGTRLRPATGYVSMLATIAKPRSSPRSDLAGRPYRYWCHRPRRR